MNAIPGTWGVEESRKPFLPWLPDSLSVRADETLLATHAVAKRDHCTTATFAERQLQQLITRVFFPGSPRPLRQVVFLDVERGGPAPSVCAQVARMLASQLSGSVCAVDADYEERQLERSLCPNLGPSDAPSMTGVSGIQASHNLYLVTSSTFLGTNNGGFNALKLQSRMSELRRKFDYLLLHGGQADSHVPTLLGQFADGVILVVQAGVTRRSVALRVKENLLATHVRLLGVVLAGREFPIPERIYRSL